MRKNTKLCDKILADCIKYFPTFKNPIVWKDYNSIKNVALWQSMTDGDGNEWHQIKLSWKLITDEADLIGTICHELIHALQYETKRPTDHGKFFAMKSAQFAKIGINTLSSDVCPNQYHAFCHKIAKHGDLFNNQILGK
jgi:hypothetical protein